MDAEEKQACSREKIIYCDILLTVLASARRNVANAILLGISASSRLEQRH